MQSSLEYDYNNISDVRMQCKALNELIFKEYVIKTENSLFNYPRYFWESMNDCCKEKGYPTTMFFENFIANNDKEYVHLFANVYVMDNVNHYKIDCA